LAVRRVCRPVKQQYGHDSAGVQAPVEPATIGTGVSKINSLPAIQ
jgi:hypothetical protein